MDSAELVHHAYNLLLNRDPDPTGLDHWAKIIQKDGKGAFVSGLLASEEFVRLYPDMPVNTPSDQIYRGYTSSDVELLQKYTILQAKLCKDHFIDGFGQKTPFDCVPFAAGFDLGRLTFPVPDDGLHAEAAEYVALVDSIERATDTYCAVEIGAGWGPWISLAGVLAKDKFQHVDLVGVEGHPARFELMKRQLAFNGLIPEFLDNVRCKLIQGAAGIGQQYLYFPDADVADMGSAASAEDSQVDYRGEVTGNIKVRSYTLSEILDGLEHVDFLHIDIQGAEYNLVAANLCLLEERVSSMMIATHSRPIEGKLIELLIGAGWHLHREKPCRVNWSLKTPEIAGMTQVDGCQYWKKRV